MQLPIVIIFAFFAAPLSKNKRNNRACLNSIPSLLFTDL